MFQVKAREVALNLDELVRGGRSGTSRGGFILASALIGWGKRDTITARLRAVSRDLVTLIFGVAILLIWAGLVEAFLSQYHEPVLPYWTKIAFGVTELVLLVVFLSRSGRSASSESNVQGSSF